MNYIDLDQICRCQIKVLRFSAVCVKIAIYSDIHASCIDLYIMSPTTRRAFIEISHYLDESVKRFLNDKEIQALGRLYQDPNETAVYVRSRLIHIAISHVQLYHSGSVPGPAPDAMTWVSGWHHRGIRDMIISILTMYTSNHLAQDDVATLSATYR